MSDAERDDFLATGRTCRVATVGLTGPHVSPLWFVWHDAALWLYSLTRSQRWTDLMRDPRVAVVVDAGDSYAELHGVEIRGTVAPIGEVPRTGATTVPALTAVESLFARKYLERDEIAYDGRHAWLRLTPEKIVSWDFRKAAR